MGERDIGRPQRHLRARRDDLRDAGGRAAVHRPQRPGHRRQGADRAAAAPSSQRRRCPPAVEDAVLTALAEASRRSLQLGEGLRRRARRQGHTPRRRRWPPPRSRALPRLSRPVMLAAIALLAIAAGRWLVRAPRAAPRPVTPLRHRPPHQPADGVGPHRHQHRPVARWLEVRLRGSRRSGRRPLASPARSPRSHADSRLGERRSIRGSPPTAHRSRSRSAARSSSSWPGSTAAPPSPSPGAVRAPVVVWPGATMAGSTSMRCRV